MLTAGGDRVAARLAREREMETLVEASVALTSRLDLTSLLVEIARRLSAILDCHFCAVSDYDEETTMVRVLADFDRQGQRVTDWKPYSLKQFPFTRRLMEDQEPGVVTLSDPRADPAETAVMRHYGDRTMLVVPLVYRGRSVGFIEVYDHLRERRFTRQELRLACALAGLATTALHNAKVFAELSRCHAGAQVVAGRAGWGHRRTPGARRGRLGRRRAARGGAAGLPHAERPRRRGELGRGDGQRGRRLSRRRGGARGRFGRGGVAAPSR